MGIKTPVNEKTDIIRYIPERFSESDTDSNEESRLLGKNSEDPSTNNKYPKAIYFILGNEFCERFCFYGLRTVLTLFLSQQLLYSENTTTFMFHFFVLLAYFTPLFGAIVADSWLGKFKTILYLSILYAIGNVILSGGAVPNELSTMKALSLAGLIVIAIGTGGIKPCVSAFGGDQFKPDQEQQRQFFFSIFYFSINLGSIFATLLTPVLRGMSCLGEESCFSLAFGVPSILMVIAIGFFLIGKRYYDIREPEGNIIVDVSKCVGHALSNKIRNSGQKKEHWLDYAEDQYDRALIEDIKTVSKVLFLYIPLPVFWALFDQQGSRWTLQAVKLDGEVLGMHIQADQVQAINPFLIIAFIPLFEYVVYPVLNKFRLLTKPLQRITVGGLLAASSFVYIGFLEISVEAQSGYQSQCKAESTVADFNLINNSPCGINVIVLNQSLRLDPFSVQFVDNIPIGQSSKWEFSDDCSNKTEYKDFTPTVDFNDLNILIDNNNVLQASLVPETRIRAHSGSPKIRIFYNFESLPQNGSFKLVSEKHIAEISVNSSELYGETDYKDVVPEQYKVYAPLSENEHETEPAGEITARTGGHYVVSIYNKKDASDFFSHPVLKPNSVPILLQAPGYILITAGEVMFSVTGLEFSYSQAPPSMKSVVQSGWLMTTALGNLINMIISELCLFEKQSYEFFMFAVIMAVSMLIFAVMAYFYKPTNELKEASDEKKEEAEAHSNSRNGKDKNSRNGKDNIAFQDETVFNKRD